MSDNEVDEFDYMAAEHEQDDIVDKMDEWYYARDDGNIRMDEDDLLTKVTDTSSRSARRGKDTQGIPWDRLSITRKQYRRTRLEQYKNYENIPMSGEAAKMDDEPSCQIPDEESSFSIPRGGPIFLPDLVSPLTRVSIFESEVFHELESLKAELGPEPNDLQEDISAGVLKIYSDEELVREAMKVAFEDDQGAGNSSDLANNPSNSGAEDENRMLDLDTSASCEQDKQIDETYLAKVEHLAKIRQKQEEDKASVKLHSFNHSKDNSPILSSGNVETLKFLELSSRPVKGKGSLTGKHVPLQYPEVLLCVEVYHNKRPSKKTQEFLVLGSQALTELRDKIRCVTDAIMQKAGDHDPSGYFLIEEFFCNDTRHPSAINYSEPILDWLRNSKEEALAKWNCIVSGSGRIEKVLSGDKPISKLPNFRSVDMQRTRFCDLGFRLGTGYLYCHQGDCKHIIVIRDMRLIHPEDVQNRAAYPLLVYQLKAILKKCSACHIYKATKVTVDDKLAGENPCYFCDNCYYLLHYSAEGTLLYDKFSVYDYVQDYY